MRAPTLITLSLGSFLVFAALDPHLVAGKLQADLEAALSKVLPAERFLVQVNTTLETVRERKLIDGESVSVKAPAAEPVPPPTLPGFSPPLYRAELRPRPPVPESRQTYRMVEREVLRSADVQVTLDRGLPDDTLKAVETLVRETAFGTCEQKCRLRFHRVEMLPRWHAALPWLWALAGAGALLSAILLLVFRRRREQARPIDDAHRLAPQAPIAPPPAVALPTANPRRREELLGLFLANAETFRRYHQSLSNEARTELQSALCGPAFSSLLEALRLPHAQSAPVSPDAASAAFNDALVLHAHQFREFVRMQEWQSRQYFGFLDTLTGAQLTTLVKAQKPVAAALMLKYLSPADSAEVLRALDAAERAAILEATSRVPRLHGEELLALELDVRRQAALTPRPSPAFGGDDLAYWENVLDYAGAEKQESSVELLAELARARPELSAMLAKLAFSLDELACLPREAVGEALAEAENEELALALVTLEEKAANAMLDGLPAARRQLVESLMAASRAEPLDKLRAARRSLTKRLRDARPSRLAHQEVFQ